jgi:O-methyltransferase involved in polyketide biosynthesis
MNTSVLEPLPPGMLEADREPLPPVATTAVAGLCDVASTLLIPLAARACGDALFPRVAQGDAHAARILSRLGADVSAYLADRASVYGVLVRTQVFRRCALRFFERHPRAIGASLGAGLGHYHQWLDNGCNTWIDADLPEVIALRESLLPDDNPRRLDALLDLTRPGWWARLGLPSGPDEPPVLLICEGVLMYLEPAQVQAVLHEVGEKAPPGSRLLLDALCWLAVGRARRHPSVRHTGAEFRWGARHWRDLTAPHPRLRLDAEHKVMEGYGWSHAALGPLFRFAMGVPLYGVAELGVDA